MLFEHWPPWQKVYSQKYTLSESPNRTFQAFQDFETVAFRTSIVEALTRYTV